MMHVFYIDPLEKLNTKKDSTLMFAISLQKQGIPCRILFEKDLAWGNTGSVMMVHKFEGELNGAYVASFRLTGNEAWTPVAGQTLHMRLDPPFDGRYLRYLWILDQWERQGVKVLNRPRGIMQFNEKLLAYQQKGGVPSWVGEEPVAAARFLEELRARGVLHVIMKPLDLYSGIGVEKHDINDAALLERFKTKARELGGPIVVQPFLPEVAKGEVRALYFAGEHIGSILKKPKEGEFLSNIAQGATFSVFEMPAALDKTCREICLPLSKEGVEWVAFDILAGVPTEVNITCPGLLVEVSHAHEKNLADVIIKKIT
jgi:glutathione synthase